MGRICVGEVEEMSNNINVKNRLTVKHNIKQMALSCQLLNNKDNNANNRMSISIYQFQN